MKKIIMHITIFVIFVVAISAVILYINIFPLAEPIELPVSNEVYAIEMEKENAIVKYIDDKEILEILNLFLNAKPTRIMTAHDRPMVGEYYTVNFDTKEDRIYTSFLYNENAKWYIEQPYVGVYKLKKGLLDFIPYIEPLNQKQNTQTELLDLIPMVKVKGKIYLDTGQESDINNGSISEQEIVSFEKYIGNKTC